MILSQEEANRLFNMEKIPENNSVYEFPLYGQILTIPILSSDRNEKFIFDIQRYTISISKIKFQTRVKKNIPLRRFEVDGSKHLNPETENLPDRILIPYSGKEIPCPHIHIYYEDWDLKWALPSDIFFKSESSDMYNAMIIFMNYCNIKTIPNIERGLSI